METLTIALEKADLLPPNRVTDNSSVLTIKDLIFEPLVGWDEGRATPALFSHWTHAENGTRWEFFIRPDAVFHDGKPCVAEDIIAVIDGLKTSLDTFGMKWSYARYLANARISAGQGRSLIVENPTPFADILDIFSDFYISRFDADGLATLGTGPYRVASYAPGQQVVVEPYDARAGGQRIILDAVPDADLRWQKLQDSSADVAIQLDHMEHPPAPDLRFQWSRRVSPLTVMAYLRCSSGIFASPHARMAANLAIDRQRLVENVYHGLAVPAATIVSPAHLGMSHESLQPIPYDPRRARELLDRTDGPRAITLRTPTAMPERAPEISRFISAALSEIGFEVTIQSEANRPEYARQVGRKDIGDLALFDSSPHSTFRVLNDKISSTTQAVWWQGYQNPAIEHLIRDANTALTQPARAAAYAACLGALQNDPPWLYLANPINLLAAKRGVAGLGLTSRGTLAIGAT